MKRCNILIIDDDYLQLEKIVEIIENSGKNYSLLEALNAKDGFFIAKKEKPDLIITDWEMPDINGLDFIKMLKQNKSTSKIPVIMCTGIKTESVDLETAFDAGFIDFIRKPIDKIEFLARIKSMLMLSNYYNEILKLKDGELISTSMIILKNNEFNLKIIKKIKEINDEFGLTNKKLADQLSELNADISKQLKNEAWQQFKTYFQRINPNFTKKLLNEYPKLTLSEINLAILIRLRLSTKEIAAVTFITPGSVKTARKRLRKKLKLKQTENLTTFLLSF